MSELAKRAVACKGWRWMPGMRWITLRQAPLDDITGRISDLPRTMYAGWMPWPKALPDLNDPATMGCLLALVRDAYGKPLSFCRYVEGNPPFWHINTGHTGATEAEALVAALEAAP